MRIVYIHQYYCNPQMTGGIRSYEQARRLVARGHTVHVITTDITPGKRDLGWRQTEDDGVDVHWFSVPYSNNMSYARRIRAFAEFMVLAGGQGRRAEGRPGVRHQHPADRRRPRRRRGASCAGCRSSSRSATCGPRCPSRWARCATR